PCLSSFGPPHAQASELFADGQRISGVGTVSGLPLSSGPRASRNGTATFAHWVGLGYDFAELPKERCNMSVSMIPGLSGMAAMPEGNSCASDWVSPSMAHFVAQ